jgi:prolyl-tRNA synthetase
MADKLTSRSEDYSRWYTDLCLQAELADYSPVKGCMVIRPHGYGIWEKIQRGLDRRIKATGHVNAYFPLFIPEDFLRREKEHVEGFAPECAVVTHAGGKELEHPLVVRPTSETIIYDMYSKWVKSYRDLPILINQWANVVRWEMRTRLFLRTTEFLWQEGHTAHATPAEAEEETLKMLGVYADFAETEMAVPVLRGVKSQNEKFAGARRTYAIEAMMQDGKALQAGTSHDLGDNFARAFDVKFQDEKGEWQYAWQTSWGVSTRLIGALIMAHSDDDGLVLPPRLAPIQVVIVPVWSKKPEENAQLKEIAVSIGRDLGDAGIDAHVDLRDTVTPGFKYHHWELRGVPLRLELGPRDLAGRQVFSARRDTKAKSPIPFDGLVATVRARLEEIQAALLEKARAFRDANTRNADSYDDFKAALDGGGFFRAHWCGDGACETAIKEDTKATIRVIELDAPAEDGACLRCGNASARRVVFARAY